MHFAPVAQNCGQNAETEGIVNLRKSPNMCKKMQTSDKYADF